MPLLRHFLANVGGFINSKLVGAVSPFPKGQNNPLGKFVTSFPLLDDLYQLVRRR